MGSKIIGVAGVGPYYKHPALVSVPSCPVSVSFAGFVSTPAPSPRERLSRSLSTISANLPVGASEAGLEPCEVSCRPRSACGSECLRRARCGKTARRDLCGGCRVTGSPTALYGAKRSARVVRSRLATWQHCDLSNTSTEHNGSDSALTDRDPHPYILPVC
jgi:hypothetical protein